MKVCVKVNEINQDEESQYTAAARQGTEKRVEDLFFWKKEDLCRAFPFITRKSLIIISRGGYSLDGIPTCRFLFFSSSSSPLLLLLLPFVHLFRKVSYKL
jgi:hypothetical protein